MSKFDVCIVGGGLAGISLAYYLGLNGINNAVILEACDRIGGLLKSSSVNGYVFDTGGSHIIFSKDRELLNEIMGLINGGLVGHRRNSKIYYKGVYVKYPFENGLYSLPPIERYECLKGIINAYISRITGKFKRPENFLEWLKQVFGDAIAEKYLIPYNRKLWKVDLREISTDWVGGRVPNPPLEDVLKSAVGVKVEGYRHQLYFTYPAVGGIESFIRSLYSKVRAMGVKVITNANVIGIEKTSEGLEVATSNGLVVKCKRAVLTSSLRKSSRMLKPLIGNEAYSLRRLRSVPLAVIGIGFKGNPLPPYHWVYYPGNDVVFHRLGFLSNYSPSNAPSNAAALIAEVSLIRGQDASWLERRVIEDLEYLKLLKESMVEVVRTWVWDDAYVIYDKVRPGIVCKVRGLLESEGVYMHGRFGSWEYLNMDAVVNKSKVLAQKLVADIKHST